jgi:hypothetical protein
VLPLYDKAGKLIAFVEITPNATADLPETDLRGFDIGGAAERLKDAGNAIAETCDSIMSAMRARLADLQPDEVELEFGVTLGGEVGVPIISKASAEATLSVKAIWHRSSTSTS